MLLLNLTDYRNLLAVSINLKTIYVTIKLILFKSPCSWSLNLKTIYVTIKPVLEILPPTTAVYLKTIYVTIKPRRNKAFENSNFLKSLYLS